MPEVKRQFFQVYTEFKRGNSGWFDGKQRTEYTLRAFLLQNLATHGLREVIPMKKSGYGVVEDVVRLSNPEAEIKYGVTCSTLYVQVSVSDKDALLDLNKKVLTIFNEFFAKGC